MPSQVFDYNATLLAMLARLLSRLTQWQAGSTEANMQKSGDNVPCPHENIIRTSNLLNFASTLLFVTEITKNALSLRIIVLVELRLC